MQCLEKNKRKFYYYLYEGKTAVVDNDGNRTGEYTISYSEPQECKGNISAGNGEAQVELFGTDITYNKVIVLSDTNCPITETSLLCLDVLPQPYEPGETPVHDYVVKAVASSLNSVSIAISKVNVNEING